MQFDARALFRAQAERLKKLWARRLKLGRGAGGRILAPKDKPDGKPLGGRIPSTITRAEVTTSHSGWRVDVSALKAVVGFHEGRSGQAARPLIDLPRDELRRNARELLDEIRRYAKAAKL